MNAMFAVEQDKPCRLTWRLWEPQEVCVVLGRSSPAEQEVDLERCELDAVPIRRRLGGGCSVVLAPGMVVISIQSPRDLAGTVDEEFERWTTVLSRSLANAGVKGLAVRGVSDVCIAERKIMGSCLYRSRDVSSYETSLLVDADCSLLSRYLKMPIRMPAYRQCRPHTEFVTTLRQQGHAVSCEQVMSLIEHAISVEVNDGD
ncbi:MAG: hypothetical protein Q8R78_05500 [Candidatus Omnitrophota bacterium]|nr:hypothetical protein [Candidatus Omnitrophota bacterium]